jgi:hypothetical protein
LFSAIDSIKNEARVVRLELEKLVNSRKTAVRNELISEFTNYCNAYRDECNNGLSKPVIKLSLPSFSDAIKGKRTVTSMREALTTELNTFKILCNDKKQIAIVNLGKYENLTAEQKLLFPDVLAFAMLATEVFDMTIESRLLKAEREKEIAKQEDEIKAAEKIIEPESKPIATAFYPKPANIKSSEKIGLSVEQMKKEVIIFMRDNASKIKDLHAFIERFK